MPRAPSADTWDIAARTATMLRAAFNFAGELGIRTGIGFEPYQNPAEIVRALPPEALSYPGGFIESSTAHDLLERRLGDLLERYPMVDHVWLWQDEDANWDSRSKDVPLSITPFAQAHDFLKRHAPEQAAGTRRMGRSDAAFRVPASAPARRHNFCRLERYARLGSCQ